MVDQTKVSAAVKELKELKELFEKIKTDSEEFFARSKKLSETGAHEAQDLVEAVKSNWEKVMHGFTSGGGLTTLLTTAFGGKKSTSKKKAAPAKKVVSSKKTSGKKAKKKKARGK